MGKDAILEDLAATRTSIFGDIGHHRRTVLVVALRKQTPPWKEDQEVKTIISRQHYPSSSLSSS